MKVKLRIVSVIFVICAGAILAEDVSYGRAYFDMGTEGPRTVNVQMNNTGSKPQTENVQVTTKLKSGGSLNYSKEETIPPHASNTIEFNISSETIEATVEWRRGAKKETIKPGPVAQTATFPSSGKTCTKNGSTIQHGQYIKDKGKIMRCNNGAFAFANDGFAGFCPGSFSVADTANFAKGEATLDHVSADSDRPRVTCIYNVKAKIDRTPSSIFPKVETSLCGISPKNPRHVACGPLLDYATPATVKGQIQDYAKIRKMGSGSGNMNGGNGGKDSQGNITLNFTKSETLGGAAGFRFNYEATDGTLVLEADGRQYKPCTVQGKDKYSCQVSPVKEF